MEAITRIVPNGFPISLQVVAATLLLGFVYSIVTKDRPLPGFPIASLDGMSPKKSYTHHGREVITKALAQYSGPFQIISGTGPKVVLPNKFADELRNHPDMNFPKAFSKDFFADYPGFEAHKQGLNDDSLIQETVRIKLTQSLNLVTNDLVDETTSSLHDVLGESEEWHTTSLTQDMLDLIARLSSRVFLGKDLCRNRQWLEIAKSYTVNTFVGSFILRLFPAITRPVVHWFIPQIRALRKAMKDAHRLIDPEVERRKARVRKALEAGQKAPKVSDAIGWMYEISRGRNVDYVAGQLSLTLAAIHTTTEVTTHALVDLCEHPEFLQPLRDEVVQVLGEYGWAKTSLYKLKLMDSFLKESQRVRTMSITSMNRWVEKEVQLSDGTILPKDCRIMVVGRFMDPTIYPDPEKFDAERFLHMREKPGQENSWQFVATSPEHMLFGHGQHACPGRFFASNEIKILLCHLLLKYDWRFPEGVEQELFMRRDSVDVVHPALKIQLRRRREEINLDIEN